MNAKSKRALMIGGGALAIVGLLWYASQPTGEAQQMGGTIGGGGAPQITTPADGANYALDFPNINIPAMPTMPTYMLMNPMDYLSGYQDDPVVIDGGANWYSSTMGKKAQNIAQYEAIYGTIPSASGDDEPTYADVNRAARKANNAATGATTTKKEDKLSRDAQNELTESGVWH